MRYYIKEKTMTNDNKDRFFVEATNGRLAFSELFDEFGACKANCIWIDRKSVV